MIFSSPRSRRWASMASSSVSARDVLFHQAEVLRQSGQRLAGASTDGREGGSLTWS